MFPEAFIKRIKQQQYINADELLHALEEPSPVTIRINRSKWDHDPTDSESVPWCRDGFYLKERPSFTLDPLFHAGAYYPQEASGMFIEQVLKQVIVEKPEVKILDLCAAPGGKSSHLSALLGGKGILVANEVIRSRASVLAENITKWGLSNSVITQSDPSVFGKLQGFFDLVLVDAPCSGEGMFRDKTALREWSEENAGLCSDRQKRILMDVWPALKENGILIYCTCTFNPAENEQNIKWLTGRHECESVRLDISDYPGITEIFCQGIYGYGFYPGRINGEGLFISVLKKTGKQEKTEVRNRSANYSRVTREEKAIAEDWTLFKGDQLIESGNSVIAYPGDISDYQLITKSLRIIRPGIKLFVTKTKRNIPEHDLAMSVHLRKESFPSADLEYGEALAYLSRGQFRIDNIQKGWSILRYRGVALGFINNIGSRINNYYPVGWRIRMNTQQKGDKNIIKWDSNA